MTKAKRAPIAFAMPLIREVCAVAGDVDLLAGVRASLERNGIARAVADHNNPRLFRWLAEVMSYQGVADSVARSYVRKHGSIGYRSVQHGIRQPACPKLKTFWLFTGCGYSKLNQTCNMPKNFRACALPKHDLRNGRLNQSAYSLALFLRDFVGGDLVTWIDETLRYADRDGMKRRGLVLAQSLVEPMLVIYGVSYKVLTMTLSDLLIGAAPDEERWVTAGGAMIAVDTLVHNWLYRTGILKAFDAEHLYGPRCVGSNGCAAIIGRLSAKLDARSDNPDFPRNFPRFVQHAIWRFCAQDGLDQCNGNHVDDGARCRLADCPLSGSCGRVRLVTKRS